MQNSNPQQFFQQLGYNIDSPWDVKPESVNIRPVRIEDAYFITELRTTEGIFENLPTIYSERIAFNHNFINNLSLESDHVLVAEVISNNRAHIIAMAGLHTNKNPRQRHSANVGVMVHPRCQGKGIGKMLMKKLIDLADNWIPIKRIELEVIEDNIPAINLYKKLGFEQEGVKKYYVYKNGMYKNAILMARCK